LKNRENQFFFYHNIIPVTGSAALPRATKKIQIVKKPQYEDRFHHYNFSRTDTPASL